MEAAGSSVLMIVAMVAIFYFMLIRPENKRKRQAEEMRNSIQKGERITTIGGMIGRVVQVNDSTIVIETSEDRVRVEIAKWGVQSTESVEKAQAEAQQKGGGLFGRKAGQEEKAAQADDAVRLEKKNFDPEIK